MAPIIVSAVMPIATHAMVSVLRSRCLAMLRNISTPSSPLARGKRVPDEGSLRGAIGRARLAALSAGRPQLVADTAVSRQLRRDRLAPALDRHFSEEQRGHQRDYKDRGADQEHIVNGVRQAQAHGMHYLVEEGLELGGERGPSLSQVFGVEGRLLAEVEGRLNWRGRCRAVMRDWMSGVSCLDRIEPSTAVPTVPPRFRQNWTWLVATPTTRCGSATCTTASVSGNVRPRPAPRMTL